LLRLIQKTTSFNLEAVKAHNQIEGERPEDGARLSFRSPLWSLDEYHARKWAIDCSDEGGAECKRLTIHNGNSGH
jgi:hypothetical protein